MASKTASLLIRLTDDVSGPAAKAAGALKGLSGAGQGLSKLAAAAPEVGRLARELDHLSSTSGKIGDFRAASRGLDGLGQRLRHAQAEVKRTAAALAAAPPANFGEGYQNPTVRRAMRGEIAAAKAARREAERLHVQAQRRLAGVRGEFVEHGQAVRAMRQDLIGAGVPVQQLARAESDLKARIVETTRALEAQARVADQAGIRDRIAAIRARAEAGREAAAVRARAVVAAARAPRPAVDAPMPARGALAERLAPLLAERKRLAAAIHAVQDVDAATAGHAPALAEYRKSLAEVRRLRAALLSAEGPAEALAAQLAHAQGAAVRAGEAFRAQGAAVRVARAALAEAGIPLGQVRTQEVQLRSAIEGVNAALARQPGLMAAAAARAEALTRATRGLAAGMAEAGRKQLAQTEASRRMIGGMSAPARAARADAAARDRADLAATYAAGRRYQTGSLAGGAPREGVDILDAMAGAGAAGLARKTYEKARDGYLEMDEATRRQRAILQFDEGKQKPLTRQAIEIGQETRFSNADVVKAQTRIGSGLPDHLKTVEVLRAITENSRDYALAMGTTMDEASSALLGRMLGMSYDMSSPEAAAKSAKHAANRLVQFAKSSGADHNDIVGYTKFGAAPGQVGGFSEEYADALAAQLRRIGYEGSMAGNFVRAAATKLAVPTDKGRGVMAANDIDHDDYVEPSKRMSADGLDNVIRLKFGKSLNTSQLKRIADLMNDEDVVGSREEFVPQVSSVLQETLAKKGKNGKVNAQDAGKIAKAVNEYMSATSGAVDIERLMSDILAKGLTPAMAKYLFGQEHGGRAQGLKVDQLRKDQQTFRNTPDDRAAKIGKEVNAGFYGAYQRMIGSFETLYMRIGQVNDGPLTAFYDKLGNAVDAVSSMPDNSLAFGTQVGAVVAGLLSLKGVLATISLFGVESAAKASTFLSRFGIWGAAATTGVMVGQTAGEALNEIGAIAAGKHWTPKDEDDLAEARALRDEKRAQADAAEARVHPSRRGEFNPEVDRLWREVLDLDNRIRSGEEVKRAGLKISDAAREALDARKAETAQPASPAAPVAPRVADIVGLPPVPPEALRPAAVVAPAARPPLPPERPPELAQPAPTPVAPAPTVPAPIPPGPRVADVVAPPPVAPEAPRPVATLAPAPPIPPARPPELGAEAVRAASAELATYRAELDGIDRRLAGLQASGEAAFSPDLAGLEARKADILAAIAAIEVKLKALDPVAFEVTAPDFAPVVTAGSEGGRQAGVSAGQGVAKGIEQSSPQALEQGRTLFERLKALFEGGINVPINLNVEGGSGGGVHTASWVSLPPETRASFVRAAARVGGGGRAHAGRDAVRSAPAGGTAASPHSTPAGAGAPPDGSVQVRAAAMYDALRGQGFGHLHASALLGHQMEESSMNPAAWNPEERAGGTIQWRLDRLSGLQAHARDQGRDWRDPVAQASWIKREMATSEARSGHRFLSTGSLEEMSAALKGYIRYGSATAADRLGHARTFERLFRGRQPGEASATAKAPPAKPAIPGMMPGTERVNPGYGRGLHQGGTGLSRYSDDDLIAMKARQDAIERARVAAGAVIGSDPAASAGVAAAPAPAAPPAPAADAAPPAPAAAPAPAADPAPAWMQERTVESPAPPTPPTPVPVAVQVGAGTERVSDRGAERPAAPPRTVLAPGAISPEAAAAALARIQARYPAPMPVPSARPARASAAAAPAPAVPVPVLARVGREAERPAARVPEHPASPAPAGPVPVVVRVEREAERSAVRAPERPASPAPAGPVSVVVRVEPQVEQPAAQAPERPTAPAPARPMPDPVRVVPQAKQPATRVSERPPVKPRAVLAPGAISPEAAAAALARIQARYPAPAAVPAPRTLAPAAVPAAPAPASPVPVPVRVEREAERQPVRAPERPAAPAPAGPVPIPVRVERDAERQPVRAPERPAAPAPAGPVPVRVRVEREAERQPVRAPERPAAPAPAGPVPVPVRVEREAERVLERPAIPPRAVLAPGAISPEAAAAALARVQARAPVTAPAAVRVAPAAPVAPPPAPTAVPGLTRPAPGMTPSGVPAIAPKGDGSGLSPIGAAVDAVQAKLTALSTVSVRPTGDSSGLAAITAGANAAAAALQRVISLSGQANAAIAAVNAAPAGGGNTGRGDDGSGSTGRVRQALANNYA